MIRKIKENQHYKTNKIYHKEWNPTYLHQHMHRNSRCCCHLANLHNQAIGNQYGYMYQTHFDKDSDKPSVAFQHDVGTVGRDQCKARTQHPHGRVHHPLTGSDYIEGIEPQPLVHQLLLMSWRRMLYYMTIR